MSTDKISQIKEMLIDALIRDLSNEDKCSPGLYTVVRGIISDNKESVNSIPVSVLEEIEKNMKAALPFKEKSRLLGDMVVIDAVFDKEYNED